MSRGAWIHAALFVVLALAAYQTWTRDDAVEIVEGSVELWSHEPSDVTSVVLELPKKTTRVERKEDSGDSYLWVVVDKQVPVVTPRSPTPDASAAPDASPPPPPEPTTRTDTQAFPTSKEGEALIVRMASLRALRMIDSLTDERKKEYGLAEPEGHLVVSLGDDERRLALGSKVYGGDDRYVLDETTGHAYVIEAESVRPLEFPESALRQRKLHDFEQSAVEAARVSVAGGEPLSVVRTEVKGAGPVPVSQWTRQGAAEPDQTLSNFMDRVWGLAPLDYVTQDDLPGPARPVFRVNYLGEDGNELGWLELFEVPGAGSAENAEPPQPVHYVKSGLTRVFARLPFQISERIVHDAPGVMKP